MLVRDVVDRVYNEWLTPAGVYRPAFDIVDVGFNDAVLSFVVRGRQEDIPNDTLLEIDDEVLVVSSVAVDTPVAGKSTITVYERGAYESAPAAHLAGAAVRLNADYNRSTILNAIKSIVGMLTTWGVYRRTLVTNMTWQSRALQPLPEMTFDVASVLVRHDSSVEDYFPLSKGKHYRVFTEFDPPRRQTRAMGAPGHALQIVCKQEFDIDPFTMDTDLDPVGVPATLQPYIAMAAAGYVLMGKEVPRVVVEEIRRMLSAVGGQVPVGSVLNVGQALIDYFRQNYVESERRRLRQLDPVKIEYVGG